MLSLVLPASYLLLHHRFAFHLQWSPRQRILLCYNKPCLRRRLSILVNLQSFRLLFTLHSKTRQMVLFSKQLAKAKLFDGVIDDLDELEVIELFCKLVKLLLLLGERTCFQLLV